MKIQFSTSNAAFDSSEPMLLRCAVVRILKEIEQKIESGQEDGVIMDVNGNKIGKWEL